MITQSSGTILPILPKPEQSLEDPHRPERRLTACSDLVHHHVDGRTPRSAAPGALPNPSQAGHVARLLFRLSVLGGRSTRAEVPQETRTKRKTGTAHVPPPCALLGPSKRTSRRPSIPTPRTPGRTRQVASGDNQLTRAGVPQNWCCQCNRSTSPFGEQHNITSSRSTSIFRSTASSSSPE